MRQERVVVKRPHPVSASYNEHRTPNNELRWLVGGVNSPVRAFRHTGGSPVLLAASGGASVIDVQGRRYTDFIMGWGASILGHRPAVVCAALARTLRQTLLPGLTHPLEIELARRIGEAVPSVEQVRFTTSGTEACLTAVRLARGITRRAKILMFDGGYHGHGESLIGHHGAGTPGALAAETLRAPYNDLLAAKRIMARHGGELACIILEPVTANVGVIAPTAGYLRGLRDLASRDGALLIFDEVVTGFRLARGGAQALYGVTPDLTTFGKIIGGGLPIGALGGPRDLMRHLAPEGHVFHAGTFAGHPLAMAAGIATLDQLRAHAPYGRLEQAGARLTRALAKAARAAGVPIQINRVGSMMTVFFTDRPVRNAADARATRREAFAQWAQTLRSHGILIPPSPFEALFLSTAHTAGELDRFVRVSSAAFQALRHTEGP